MKDLKLQDALDDALTIEAADNNAKALHRNDDDVLASVKKFSSHRPTNHQATRTSTASKTCYRCSRSNHHQHSSCLHKDATCHHCGKKGHLSRVCPSKHSKPAFRKPDPDLTSPHGKTRKTHHIAMEEESPAEEMEKLHLYHVTNRLAGSKPIMCTLQIEDQPLDMEVDTGADVSLISMATKQQFFSSIPLLKTAVNLKTYTNKPISVAGQMNVRVKYGQQSRTLVLLVVAGTGTGTKPPRQEVAEGKSVGLAQHSPNNILVLTHYLAFESAQYPFQG